MRATFLYDELQKFEAKQLSTVSRTRLPQDLPPIVKVLLGVASPEEVRICRVLIHNITPSDWKKVTKQADRYLANSLRHPTADIPMYLDVVQDCYSNRPSGGRIGSQISRPR